MRKQIMNLIFALVMVLMLPMLVTEAQAATVVASGYCGANVTWQLDDAGTLTISGIGAMEDYSHPGYVPWYSQQNSIRSIVLEEGVTSIGDYAFYSTKNLNNITLPTGVTSVGYCAFYYCTSLSSITIPDSVTSIGDFAFLGCTNLSSITIMGSVTSIGDFAFQNCTNLSSITIPESVTSIGNSAFSFCKALKSITLPQTLTSIGEAAFENCDSLTGITIPEGVTSIGEGVFYDCNNLSSITIPDSVTSIGPYAFYGCASLGTVHYAGTEEQKADLTVLANNLFLTGAIWHYECDGVVCTNPPPSEPGAIDFEATKVNWTGIAETETQYNNTEGLFVYAFDGNTNTIWHSNWRGNYKDVLTGENTFSAEINFGDAYNINQFSFLPRMDLPMVWDVPTGIVLQASLFLKASADADWVLVADQVTFEYNQDLKTFYFTQQDVQFVKFVAERASHMGESDMNGSLGYATVSEFYIDDAAAADRTITVSKIGDGTVTAPKTAVAGSSVTVTAEAAEGYTFDGWYNAYSWTTNHGQTLNRETKVSDAAEYTFPAATNIALTAKFVANTYTVTIDYGYDEQTTTRTVTHGNTVSLPNVTREGYTFDGWFDAEGNAFTAQTVVTGDITVTAVWNVAEPEVTEPKPTEPEVTEPEETQPGITQPEEDTSSDNPFVDVFREDYYYDPVLWAVKENITKGMDETHFAPTDTCTRGQIVTFLWRACGSPEPKSGYNPFQDVNLNDYFYKAVLWAVENGITSGVSANQFASGAPCTRGQVATFLWRSQGQPSVNGENIFTDIAPGAYYYEPVLWAVEKGITNGVGEGLFAPDATCTRGQIVTFLYRAVA